MPSSFLYSNNLATALKNYYAILSQRFKTKWSTNYQLTHRPLLDNQDLFTIHASAKAGINPLTSKYEVSTLLVGERSSSYAGSGYEFAENQLYVSGDDTRFINWRMFARTGKMYRKKFVEERRPELWVIVDKQASMRFGTEQYLKVTQAAIQAVYHLYLAQQQQLACAGVILDETIHWYKPSQDNNSLQSLINDIIAPAPPLSTDTIPDRMNFTLRQLATRATAGSIIILLSDFHHLPADMPGTLYTLTRKHQVTGIHILDPIELELPNKGQYQVAERQGYETYLLDCDNSDVRTRYNQIAERKRQDIEQKLTGSGVSYQLCKLTKQ